MHGVYDCARFGTCWPNRTNQYCLLISERDRHLEVRPISQLNTQPVVSPVNASRLPSQVTAHHSGPRRWARPYLVEDFHLLSFASLSWRTQLWVAKGPSSLQIHRPKAVNQIQIPESGQSSLSLSAPFLTGKGSKLSFKI